MIWGYHYFWKHPYLIPIVCSEVSNTEAYKSYKVSTLLATNKIEQKQMSSVWLVASGLELDNSDNPYILETVQYQK